MKDVLILLGIFVAYLVLIRVVFPRLGIQG